MRPAERWQTQHDKTQEMLIVHGQSWRLEKEFAIDVKRKYFKSSLLCLGGYRGGGRGGVLTTGHTGKAAGVIEAIQSLAGIIRPVHAFPTLHTGSCQHNGGGDKNRHKHAFSRE